MGSNILGPVSLYIVIPGIHGICVDNGGTCGNVSGLIYI